MCRAVLLKLGKRVADGSGPDGDIVGFSTTCPHKGFPLSYNKSDRTLNCPGHYSRSDCEAGGARLISSLKLQLALSTKWVRTVYSTLRFRPRGCRWRLREYLGHWQALLRCHEGKEHPHPQSSSL